jgi:cell division protein FtsB
MRLRLRSLLRRRWVLLVLAGGVAFLYSRPVASYLHVRAVVANQAAQIQQLERRRDRLTQEISQSQSDIGLAREARRLGLVQPGQQLYIVKGISQWRRAHRASIKGHG